jgi:hypothetical protein
MALDPDSVRVDLLKIKRKLFLSYPEGSRERQDFLIASKLSELNYLSKLVPHDVVDLVFEEYHKILKEEITAVAVYLILGTSVSMAMAIFRLAYPQISWLHLWGLGFVFGFLAILSHVWRMIDQWRKIQPFKKDYKELQKRIDKLADEIKDIG